MANGGGFSGQTADLKTPPIARKRPFTPPLSRHSRTLAGPHSTDLPNSPGFGLESQAQHQAGVAQLVEQRIRNAKVGSSTLFTGTKFQKATLAVAFCFSGAAQSLAAGQPPHPTAPTPCHFVALNPSRGFRRLDARTLTPSRSADSSHILRCVGARTRPTLLRRHRSPDLSTWLNAGTSPNAPPVTRHPSSVIRHPSSHYQINHNLIFATAIHSQHINHTLIFKPTPP